MSVTILNGDCRAVLKTLADNSVQCCVTSPPYYGLRDYGCEGQIGLEQTPNDYVNEMVEVFREVRRVLRADGTCWLNLGDCYNSIGHKKSGSGYGTTGLAGGKAQEHTPLRRENTMPGLKHKDLMFIPVRTAMALQADGWWVRSDIIWHKPNPMPESCRDRPTSAHEHVFLLTKSDRYFYDYEAAKEKAVSDHPSGNGFKRGARLTYADKDGARGSEEQWTGVGGTRNARNVWTITTKPYKGAHFATMPIDLAERCIRAGTSEHGACASCASPYERIVEKGEPDLEHQIACGASVDGSYDGQDTKDYATAGAQSASDTKRRILAGMVQKTTVGWKPTCACGDTAVVPCMVLDPFGGAGTTGLAATNLGCDATLIELNPEYVGLAQARVGIEPVRAPTVEEMLAEFL